MFNLVTFRQCFSIMALLVFLIIEVIYSFYHLWPMSAKCQYSAPIIVTMKDRQNKTVKLLSPHFFTYLWIEGHTVPLSELQVWHFNRIKLVLGQEEVA